MIKRVVSVLCAVFVFSSFQALAQSVNQCTNIFPDAVSSHSSSGTISFEWESRIEDSVDNVLDVPNINDQNTSTGNKRSCKNVACSSSGNSISPYSLPTFQTSSSNTDYSLTSTSSLAAGEYKDITLKNKKTLQLSTANGVYKIKKLLLESETKVEIKEGVFWIETLNLKYKSQIKYKGSSGGTAIILTNSLLMESESKLNKEGGDDAANLLLIDYGDLNLKYKAKLEGFIYVDGRALLESSSEIDGALTAENIEMKSGAKIKHRTIQDDIDDENFCEGTGTPEPTPLPDPIAHWNFDVCDINGGGDVVDVIAGNNGTGVSGADIEKDSKFCQGAEFQGTGAHINIPHSDDYELSSGAISFWFNTADTGHENNSSHGGQGLFSKDSSGPDNGGHLTIWIRDNADLRIRVRHQNPSDKDLYSDTYINTNQWYHLVYTWGNNGMKLFIDGVEEDSRSDVYGIENNLEPIILGANAWVTGDGVSDPSKLKDFFKGQIDDVKMFDEMLTQQHVNELYAQSSYTCEECVETPPQLVGHWKANVCSLPGTSGDFVDVINGNNGQSMDGTSIDDNGKFCQAAAFDGEDDHINIEHANAFALNEGSLSFWFKTDDVDHQYRTSHSGQGLWSKDSANQNNGGDHLTIWLTDEAGIKVRHQQEDVDGNGQYYVYSSNDSINNDQWHHLAYTWGDDGMQLFLDGVLVDSDPYTGGLAGNPEPITLGANAWITGESTSPSSQLRDLFKGSIDDFRLYDGQLSTDEVVAIRDAVNEDTCEDCYIPPTLVSHWPIDICSLDGDENEIIDIVSGYGASAIDGADVTSDGKFCQSAEFTGEGGHIDIEHQDAFAAQQGAISFWFNTTDMDFSGESDYGAQTLISKDAQGNGDGGHLTIWLTDSGTVEVRHQSDDDQEFIESNISVSENAWHHMLYSWGDDGMQLFLNGQLVASDPGFKAGLEANEELMVIGANTYLSDDEDYDDDHDDDDYDDHDHDGHDGHRHHRGRGHHYHGRGYGYGHGHHYFCRYFFFCDDEGDDDDDDEDEHDDLERLTDFFIGKIDDVRFYSGSQPNQAMVTSLYSEAEGDCESCVEEVPELVAHYTSDVCAINGDGGSYIDIINGLNGQYVDGVSLTNGKFCKAASFSGIDEHINIPHSAEFEIAKGAVAFWVNVTDLSYENDGGSTIHDGQALFSKDSRGLDDGSDHLTIWVKPDGNIRVRHQVGGEHEIESTDQPIGAGTWHHIAYTFGMEGKRLYIDGVLKASEVTEIGGLTYNPEPIILGANASVTDDEESAPEDLRNWFKGSLDDVRIYGNEQPDAAFISALYQEVVSCQGCDDDLAEYKFEGTPNTALNDETGVYNGAEININGSNGISFLHGTGGSTLGSCQVLSVPKNDSGTIKEAVDTTINPATDIGPSGTISFWYQANELWGNGRARQLFDASNHAIYFYGLILDNGTVRFGMEDPTDGDARVTTSSPIYVQPGTWTHLAFTWDLSQPYLKIFVNGVEQDLTINNMYIRQVALGTMNSLYIGDNNHSTYYPGATGNSADGQFDDFRVYTSPKSSAEIQADMADKEPCSITVDHYEIEFTDPGSVCSANSITIKACANADCSQLYTNNPSVSPIYTDSDGVTFYWPSITLTGGIVDDYPITLNEAQTIAVGLSGSNPSASYECNPNDCQLTVQDYSIQIQNSVPNTDIPTQIAESTFTGDISVVPSGSCVTDVVPQFSVALECVEPAQCSGTPLSVNGVSVATSDDGSVFTTIPGFDLASGISLDNMSYADVGKVKLHVKVQVGDTVATDTSEFVVKPYALQLSDSIPTTHTAGEDFQLTVTALGSSGSVLPSYQASELAFALGLVTPEPTDVSNRNAALTDGDSGTVGVNTSDSNDITSFDTVTNNPSFSNGTITIPVQINEVGEFAVDIQDQNYLGTGEIPSISSVNGLSIAQMAIGRFVPAYFGAQMSYDFGAYCGGFTYRGDSIDTGLTGNVLTLTAMNADGDETRYYDSINASNSAFKFSSSEIFTGRTYVNLNNTSESAIAGTDFTADATLAGAGDFDGSFTYTFNNDAFVFNKGVTPVVPVNSGETSDDYNIQFSIPANLLTDSDGVGYKADISDNGFSGYTEEQVITDIEIRDGRLTIQNGVGAEAEIKVYLVAQFFGTDETWDNNSQDSCTAYDYNNLSVVTGSVSPANISVEVLQQGSGILNSGRSSASETDSLKVLAGITDESPQVKFNLEYDIPSNLHFLKFNWRDDSALDNPMAEVSLGQYSGNDRIIHWREVLR
ncbi:MAG: hypothetical protein GJ680_10180 [Alteromonadaceae bacterium]|nr:hypothetical protein [Alteromonadaceae bacterium]